MIEECISQSIFAITLNIANNLDFNFNETGFPFNIVPNIIHYILFSVKEIKFQHFLSIISVLKNQRPDQIYIHCDCNELSGDYYRRVLRVANKTKTSIIIRSIEKPTQIFGKNLSKNGLIGTHLISQELKSSKNSEEYIWTEMCMSSSL